MSKLLQYAPPIAVRLLPEDEQAFRRLLALAGGTHSDLLRRLLRHSVRQALQRQHQAAAKRQAQEVPTS